MNSVQTFIGHGFTFEVWAVSIPYHPNTDIHLRTTKIDSFVKVLCRCRHIALITAEDSCNSFRQKSPHKPLTRKLVSNLSSVMVKRKQGHRCLSEALYPLFDSAAKVQQLTPTPTLGFKHRVELDVWGVAVETGWTVPYVWRYHVDLQALKLKTNRLYDVVFQLVPLSRTVFQRKSAV